MSKNKVLWLKVSSIAAVQAAITLTWVIYNLYLPLLLVQFGLSKQLAISLLIGENILESVIEPVFGGLSDRHQQLFGSRVPLISIGIVLSSTLFIILPSLVIFFSPAQFSVQWLLPVLAVLWAGAMAIFRAPTMTLLRRCAPSDKLPQAASVLTLVGGIVGAFRFDAFGVILNLGAGFAFALGSFSLLVAAGVLRLLNPDVLPTLEKRKLAKVSPLLLSLIFTLGVWVSWSLRFVMPTVSQVLKLQFGQDNGKLAMTIFMVMLGLAALPAGKIATKLGDSWGMQLGSIGSVLALSLLILLPDSNLKILAIAMLITFFSLVLNGIIPFTFGLVPPERSGLGVGMYFGGLGAGFSSFDLIFAQLNSITFETRIIGAIVSLLLVFCWLLISNKLQKPNPKQNIN